MSRLFAYLGRLAVIVFGFFCAALAASAFMHVLILGGQGWTADEAPYVVAGSAFVSIPFVALFVAYFAFMPSIPALVLAEYLGRRDWLFFALAGASIALVILGLRRIGIDGPDTPVAVSGMVACGLVGGIAYWLVAGRSSGLWIQGRRDVTAPGPSES